jgi:two-component system, NarL family, sensor kinase
MKYTIYIIAFLFFVVLKGYGQEDRIKLLKHDLQLAKSDTHKLKLINELSSLLVSNRRQNELLENINYGLKLSEKIKDKYWEGQMYVHYGSYYESLGDFEKAKSYFEKSIKIYSGKTDVNSIASLGTSWAEIGALYNHQGDLGNAIKYSLKGAEVWEKSNLKEKTIALGNIYSSIATMFFQNKQLEKALQYDLKAVKIREKGNLRSIDDAKTYLYVSSDYSGLKNYDSALVYLKKGKVLVDELKTPTLSAEYDRTFAKLFLDQKKYKEALPYGLEALKIGLQIKDEFNIKNAHNVLSQIYLKLNQAQKALYHSQEELKIVRKNNEKRGILKALFNLSKSENAIGNYKNAYDHLLEYKVMKDSVFASTEKLKLNEIEAKYNGAQKQNEILEKNMALNKSNTRNWFLGGGLVVFALLASLFFNNYKKDQQTKALEAELAIQKTERQRIASEMHDELGGNLTSLMYLTHNLKDKASKNKEVDKIIQISGNISDSINEIVWALNQEQNLLADWVFYVRGKTAELFENAGVKYTYTISEPIPERTLSNIEKRNLYLVVKEAINNAIKHSKANTYQVNMDFANGINLIIKDNGIGFVENGTPKAGGGNGLKNMSRRMAEICGSIAWSNGEGTTVEIKL